MAPLVSVLLPTRNRLEFLRYAIETVCARTITTSRSSSRTTTPRRTSPGTCRARRSVSATCALLRSSP